MNREEDVSELWRGLKGGGAGLCERDVFCMYEQHGKTYEDDTGGHIRIDFL